MQDADKGMVERVARAICEAHNAFSGQDRPWDAMTGPEREYGVRLARAALAAIREPLWAEVWGRIEEEDLSDVEVAFRRAIDDALNDESAPGEPRAQ